MLGVTSLAGVEASVDRETLTEVMLGEGFTIISEALVRAVTGRVVGAGTDEIEIALGSCAFSFTWPLTAETSAVALNGTHFCLVLRTGVASVSWRQESAPVSDACSANIEDGCPAVAAVAPFALGEKGTNAARLRQRASARGTV